MGDVRRILMCAAGLAAMMFFSSPSHGKVIFVDVDSKYNAGGGNGTAVSPFGTLTAAVAASVEGDTILVEEGRYNEASGEVYPIPIPHSLAIIGRGRYSTVVEINEYYGEILSGYPVGSQDPVDVASLVVDGIGFEGTDLSSVMDHWLDVDEFVVRNCRFDGLWVAFANIRSAGIQPASTVSIVGNTGDGPTQAPDCGSMAYYFDLNGLWDRIDVVDNSLAFNYHAIYGGNTAQGRMVDNIFLDYCDTVVRLEGQWTIVNNVIARWYDDGPPATGNGGEGIYLRNGDGSIIANNTVWGMNREGIDLLAADNSTVQLVNNIVTANVQYGISWGVGNGNPDLRFNNVYGNGPDYPAGYVPPASNISVDPYLDPDGIHLTSGSQCIDAGEDVSWLLTTDVDHETRVAPFDIGADEYVCSTADNDGDGWTECSGDCDDTDPKVNPGMNEKGKRGNDGIDNDCNGIIDG